MLGSREESYLAYFLSISHCSREETIKLLEKSKWKVDLALNLFYEQDSKKADASHEQIEKQKPKPPLPSRKPTIIIPTMFEFQR